MWEEEAVLPLPPVALLLRPVMPLKLNKGREVKPGQKASPLQGVQNGTMPEVPKAQPRHERLCASAWLSELKPAKAEGRRGEGQVRGMQSVWEDADAVVGCCPGGQL